MSRILRTYLLLTWITLLLESKRDTRTKYRKIYRRKQEINDNNLLFNNENSKCGTWKLAKPNQNQGVDILCATRQHDPLAPPSVHTWLYLQRCARVAWRHSGDRQRPEWVLVHVWLVRVLRRWLLQQMVYQ